MKLTPKKIGSMLNTVALHSHGEEHVKHGVKFIAELIVKSGKTGKLGGIIESFKKNYNQETETADVTITSADEYSFPHLKDIGGKKVSIKKVVDKSLIGGVKIQTEDFLVDNSIASKISRLKHIVN